MLRSGNNTQDDHARRLNDAGLMSPVREIESSKIEKNIGTHLLAEFRISPAQFGALSVETVNAALLTAAKDACATILDSHFFVTATGGISGIVVIKESHFAIHFLPDPNDPQADIYAAFCGYTCGNMYMAPAIQRIVNELKMVCYADLNFTRGILIQQDPQDPQVFIPGLARFKRHDSLKFFKLREPATITDNNARLHHVVLELYCANKKIIDDAAGLEAIIRHQAEQAGLVINKVITVKFDPQGVSIVAIGDGFKIASHTWPELGYAPWDIVVPPSIDAMAIAKGLVDGSDSKRASATLFLRGGQNQIKPAIVRELSHVSDAACSHSSMNMGIG